MRRTRANAIGRADYSTSDFVEDVKRACAREAVLFDNDVFNELAVQARSDGRTRIAADANLSTIILMATDLFKERARCQIRIVLAGKDVPPAQ